MATTSNTYTGNGSNKLFSITFPYLDTSDINVYLNGTLQTITTQYTFANATTVEFVTAPANGAVVLLDRSTDDSTLQATFFPGSSIKANDLNFNFDQVLYLAQETANSAANQSTAGLQTQITAATNTANAAVVTANTANATANTANTTANGIAGTANTALTTANAAEATANGIAATANTALSNSSTAVTTANAAVATANAAAQIVRGTAVATTSGTSVDFTGIPSWVKRLTVVFTTLSQSGSAYVLFQLGDSGGVETTGYTSTANFLQGGTSSGTFSSTAGIVLLTGSTPNQITGSVVFNNINSNTWVATGMYNYNNNTGITGYSAGDKTLSNTLDRIRITSTNGTDTFDAGLVNIIYEG
jgi:hypothetical protein